MMISSFDDRTCTGMDIWLIPYNYAVNKVTQRETYKGKNLFVDETADVPKLSIDGKEIVIERVEDGYWTNLAPFTTYKKSLVELARTLVDIGVIHNEVSEG